MRWINTDVSTLRAPAFIGSSPAERGTWFCVLGHSVEQENGGRVENASEWKDRQWQQTCGVTRREVRAASRLLTWDGDDLIVSYYPIEKELEVKGKREAGRIGGEASGQARAKQAGSTASSSAADSASRECNGREGKGSTPVVPKGTNPDSTGHDEGLIWARELFWRDARRKMPHDFVLDSSTATAWRKNKKAVAATDDRGWALLQWLYSRPEDSEAGRYRRKALAQLLNNWNTEIDRAAAAAAALGVSINPDSGTGNRSEKKERAVAPEDWGDRYCAVMGEEPEADMAWERLPRHVQDDILKEETDNE